jgi:hypothetical protein
VRTKLAVTPKKPAGRTIISDELVSDSVASALQVVRDGMVFDSRTHFNAEHFGTAAANGPDSVQNVAEVTTMTGHITNLDGFAEAVSKAEIVGQQSNSWVAHPTAH